MPFVKLPSGKSFHYIIPSCPDHSHPSLDPKKPTGEYILGRMIIKLINIWKLVLLLHPRFFDSYFFAPQFRDARLAESYNLVGAFPNLCSPFSWRFYISASNRSSFSWWDQGHSRWQAVRLLGGECPQRHPNHCAWLFFEVAKDILLVLDDLQVSSCHIFGNSLGGPIAVRMTTLDPKRVLSLILCAKHPPVEV